MRCILLKHTTTAMKTLHSICIYSIPEPPPFGRLAPDFNPDALASYPLPILNVMIEKNYTQTIDETVTTDYTINPIERKDFTSKSQLLN